MSSMKYLEKLLNDVDVTWLALRDVAKYSDVRINSAQVSKATYVGVDNLLPNRAGKSDSNYTPTEGRLIEFLEGDVLVGNIRPYLKKIWLSDRQGGANGDILVIRPTHPSLSADYLYHVLSSDDFFTYNMQHAKGAKMPRGDKAKILEYQIPIPCLGNRQKSLAIQSEIDRILGTISKLSAKLTVSLNVELTARKKQCDYYRQQLLSFEEGGEGWKSLSDVVYFNNAKPHEKLVSPDGDVALLTAGFISTDGRSARFVKRVDVLTPALKNDIAMVMSDLPNGKALAKTFFIEESDRYAVNQRVCLLRAKDPTVINPKFLFYILNRNQQLLAYNNGIDQTHLKKDWILNCKVPTPPISDQDRIVTALEKIEALTLQLTENLALEIDLRRKQVEYYCNLPLRFQKLNQVAA